MKERLMRMRNGRTRRVGIALLLCALLCLLSACHGRQEGQRFAVPDHFDADTPVEIVFWAKNDTNKDQVAVYQRAIDGFEALYPNVTVNMRLYTDYSRIYNDVITNISTGTTPNVCVTYPDHIATYLTGQNTVLSLDELMADSRFGLGGSELRFDAPTKEEIVPEFLAECEMGEKIMALPFMRSTEAVYINRDFVEKLGYEVPEVLTWEYIWEVSEKALEKDEAGLYRVNGQNVLIPFIYKSTDNMMISMLKQLDAPYSTDAGEIQIFNDTTRTLLEEIFLHGKSRAFSTFAISSYPANFLNAGQCVFAIDSTAGATWMGSEAPLLDIPEDSLVRFTTEVRPIPQFDTQNPKMISQGPSMCVFVKENPQEVLASWLFMQYLLTDEIQMGYAETEGYLPVTRKTQQNAAYQDYLARKGEDNGAHYRVKIEASELLMNHTSDTFVTPVFNGSASLRQAAGQLIENTVKAARRKQEMNDAFIEKLYSEVSSLYRLDQSGGGEKTARDIPLSSWLLLGTVAGVWVVLGACQLVRKLKARQKAQ